MRWNNSLTFCPVLADTAWYGILYFSITSFNLPLSKFLIHSSSTSLDPICCRISRRLSSGGGFTGTGGSTSQCFRGLKVLHRGGATVKIEAEEDAIGVPKVGGNQTHVFLLACTVPQLQSAVDTLMLDSLAQEVDADGGLRC
jgi:hypothetical protein